MSYNRQSVLLTTNMFTRVDLVVVVVVATAAILAACEAANNKRPPTSCLDENGRPIDWLISYKLPVIRKARSELFKSGWAYASISSQSAPQGKRRRGGGGSSSGSQEGWRISHLPITDHESLIMRILEPIHGSLHIQGLSTVFYSDQPPNMKPPSSRMAHAKGVLAMDETTNTGFWLTHSIPRFPQPHGEQLEMSANSRRFGQSFMCISFKMNEAGRQIVEHLVNMSPMVYEADLSESLVKQWPQLALLEAGHLRRKRYQCIPRLHQLIKMTDGKQVQLFSKCGQDGSDMFEWLNDALESNLYVETWRNGVGKLGSNCPRHYYHVNNVQMLHMSSPVGDLEWSYRKDHSKWAITTDEDNGHVCLSDINRMESQKRRGGGAICIECANCWQSFRSSISGVEQCDGSTASSSGLQGEEEEEADVEEEEEAEDEED